MYVEFTNDEVLELIDSVNDRIEGLYDLAALEDEEYKYVHFETIETLKGIARKLGEDAWDE